MELNIIADIAGQYDSLLRLVAKMPKAPFLSLGDMVDRGPKSREVLEWFMANGKALMGNHEHMMITSIDGTYDQHNYTRNDWFHNGGGHTLRSFEFDGNDKVVIPTKLIDWLKSLPLEYKQEGLVVTHAPISDMCFDPISSDIGRKVWARGEPSPIEGVLQVHGHNAYVTGLKWWRSEDGKSWAVCLDDSKKKVLTGMHWPSLELYQEPY